MKALYDFIIKPLGDTYDNKIKIDGLELILNTKIESFKFVNNLAIVVETPLEIKTPIKKGDIILIHHNVFRTFYDIKGIKKKSRSFFKDNLYFCALDQVYLYKRTNTWKSINERCFIQPLKNTNKLTTEKEQKLIGVLKIGNSSLEALGIHEGDTVGYTPYGEYDFIVNEKRLYCMKSNDIVIKYGNKKNQAEYNPSWSSSS
jgi:co-chaperonin GroES (HSP10)